MGAIILDGYEELRKKYPIAVPVYKEKLPDLRSAHINFLKRMGRYGRWRGTIYSLMGDNDIDFETRGNDVNGNWRRFISAIEREMARYEAYVFAASYNYAS